MYIPVFTCLLSDSVSPTLVRYSVLQVSAQLTVWPMASSVLVSAITLHLCQLLCNCLSVACTVLQTSGTTEALYYPFQLMCSTLYTLFS